MCVITLIPRPEFSDFDGGFPHPKLTIEGILFS